MFCKKCGGKIIDRYCVKCGQRVEDIDLSSSSYEDWPLALILTKEGYSCYDSIFTLETDDYETKEEAIKEIEEKIEEMLSALEFDKSKLPSIESVKKDKYIVRLSKREDFKIEVVCAKIDSWLYDDHHEEQFDEAQSIKGNWPVVLFKNSEGYSCYDISFQLESELFSSYEGAMENITKLVQERVDDSDDDEYTIPSQLLIFEDKKFKKIIKKKNTHYVIVYLMIEI